MKRLFAVTLLLLGVSGPGARMLATELDQHLSVSGIEIYYGVVPAPVVQDTPAHAKSATGMHGKPNQYADSHHLVVSLYDSQSGRRITDAAVTATVSALGYRHEEKPLTLMTTGSVQSYGNFFRLSGSDTFRIDLKIQRKGAAAPVAARFNYRPATGQ